MARTSFPYANDAATLEDGFGTTLAGDQVARMALEAATPFTLGVVGKWGSGKTSVLRRGFVTLGGQAVQLEVPFTSPKKDTVLLLFDGIDEVGGPDVRDKIVNLAFAA